MVPLLNFPKDAEALAFHPFKRMFFPTDHHSGHFELTVLPDDTAVILTVFDTQRMAPPTALLIRSVLETYGQSSSGLAFSSH